MTWVHVIVMWETDFEDLLHTPDTVLGRLECIGVCVATHEYMPYDTSISDMKRCALMALFNMTRNRRAVGLTSADLNSGGIDSIPADRTLNADIGPTNGKVGEIDP